MEVLRFNKTMLLMIIMSAMMWNMVKSEEHFVGGGKYSWVPEKNLTEWSLNQHFHVNDWLSKFSSTYSVIHVHHFGYCRHNFNVLQVNKTAYENCIDTGFIKNVTGGVGRDVFKLTEPKIYYFISGGGFCFGGIKVAIDVTGHVAPALQPTPPKKSGGSALDASNFYHSLVVLILILMCTNFLG